MEHTECSQTFGYKIQAYEDGTYSVPKRWHIKFRPMKVECTECSETLAYKIQACEDGTYRVFRNVGV